MSRSAGVFALLALLAVLPLAPADPASAQPADPPEARVSGVVVNADGEPVEGAWVDWNWAVVQACLVPGARRHARGLTDAEGGFTLPGAPGNGPRRIYAAVPGGASGASAAYVYTKGSGRSGIEIRLSPDLYVRCEVRTPEGAAPEKVRILFRWTGRDPWTHPEDDPRDSGSSSEYPVKADFELHGLNGQSFDLYLNVYGYRVVHLPSAGLLPGEDGKPRTARVTLETGLSISGRVLDAEGAPVAGTCVHVNRRADRQKPFNCRHGYTRKDGTFTVSGIEAGVYDVRVNALLPGKAASVLIEGVKTGTTDLILRFKPVR